MTRDPRSKATIVLKLLEEGDIMLCLDARHEGVAVPREHAQNPSLRLILNLNFPSPIDVTDEGVSVNLAFGGRRFDCYVPMDALWAVFNPENMQGMMWPESMPPEVQAELAAQKDGTAAKPSSERPGPRVASSPRRAKAAKAGTEEKSEEQPATRKRGHLRVVK
ncbi:MAG: ClpXP protease specificity-enhancing factor SspB [Candidatus Tectomicrobia bacterium]|nr:ClpXP protease specificity-enhancing factor SspB [Candidatus Tectomicrobia bacterium]